MSPQGRVLGALANLGIRRRFEHPPVATVAEAEALEDIDAAHCKNLFLRNQKGDRHYLVILSFQQARRSASRGGSGGRRQLRFASPERLMKYPHYAGLGVTIWALE
jgi:Ala-tRNA(Pro) deacylase